MKFNIYAIRDIKKNVYLQPWFVPFYVKKEDVVIDFTRNLKSAESIFNQFPGDFQLEYLGDFMDEIGTLSNLPEAVVLCKVSDLLKEEKKEEIVDGVGIAETGEII